MSVLIADKIDCNIKTRNKETLFIIIRGSIYQEDKTIIYTYI